MSDLDPAALGALGDPAQCHEPIDLAGTSPDVARAMLERMMLIRAAEERIGDAVAAGEVTVNANVTVMFDIVE